MKNKEIEELLNDIKKQLTIDEKLGKEIAKDFHKTILSYEGTKLLLSHIEQLEEELKQEKKDYKETNDKCFELINENKQLENNRDKAIEVIDLITPELWNISNAMTYKLKDIKYILKGGSDENIR